MIMKALFFFLLFLFFCLRVLPHAFWPSSCFRFPFLLPLTHSFVQLRTSSRKIVYGSTNREQTYEDASLSSVNRLVSSGGKLAELLPAPGAARLLLFLVASKLETLSDGPVPGGSRPALSGARRCNFFLLARLGMSLRMRFDSEAVLPS